MKRQRAFTLLELLVAMFITAVIFALGYGAINQAISNRATLLAAQDRLTAVQTAMRLMVQDFSQMAPRPIRNPLGDGYLPAISADARSGELVSLTRAGWNNPAGLQRAALQRVRYVLKDKHLRREYWSVLDATLKPDPRSRDLLDGVKSARLRFMDDGLNWRDQWPPATLTTTPTPRDLRWRPIAVEITLELEDYGTLVRLIEVAG